MRAFATAAAALLMAAALSACAVTQQVKPESNNAVPTSGFLSDYSKLHPGAEGQALLIYVRPGVNWNQYKSVMILPVTMGLGPDSQVSDQDQQVLASYYYNALVKALSPDYAIVDQPGPDTMKIRVALTDATTATPVLRTISVVIPQARVLSAGKNLATGSYAFVGSARSEGEILDSVTGEQLAAAVDERSGGASIKNANVWKWGDAEKAMDYWAQRLAQRLTELRAGQPLTQ